MKEGKELLAYCVLYCGDCACYSGEIADAASSLKEVLEEYSFDRTAKCLFSEKLRDYDRFFEMLGFMTDLRCSAACREREDSSTSCEVRKCCKARGFFACYECDDLETCDKLKSLHDGLSGDSYVRNAKAIREMGLEAWIAGGERLWFGSAADTPTRG